MKNNIILEAKGGLANRMRVIVSGIWFAENFDKKVKLIWNIDSGLNSPFEELFEPINNCTIVRKRFFYYFFRSTEQKTIFKQISIFIITKLLARRYFILEDAGVKTKFKCERGYENIVKGNKTLYLRTCEEFGGNGKNYNHFIPKPDIQKRIGYHSSFFNEKTIGVHIRRTDHSIAIQKSPIELFVERIKKDLACDPNCNYFLSTDDSETEALLKKLFGEKIMVVEKKYSRNLQQGIIDAVVDLYCLSNTSKIYGSFGSSFSEVASQIKGIELEKLHIQ